MKKNTALILGILVLAIFIFSFLHYTKKKSSNESDQNNAAEETLAANANPSDEAAKPAATPQTTASAGFLPTSQENTNRFDAFKKSFEEMGKCLNISVKPADKQADMNFEALNSAVASDLGEAVATNEDWNSTEIKTPSGESRKIIIMMAQSEGPEPTRYMRYTSIGGNGEEKELPLTAEQRTNPSDTLVASLESDGEVTARSVAKKVYYQNGDEMSYTEKNGHLISFELIHDGKTFRCSEIGSCQCI
jgi:hypothetical protein